VAATIRPPGHNIFGESMRRASSTIEPIAAPSRLILTFLLGAALAFSAPPLAAQSTSSSAFGPQYLEPLPSDNRERVPRLSFKLLHDIRLPGPLPERGPRLVGDRIEIPVAGSIALTDWTGDSELQLSPGELSVEDDPQGPPWALSDDGKVRYRVLPKRGIVAEKRCPSCKKGWRKKWRLRNAGGAQARPLVSRRRLFFGGLDNRVYCVKRRNGHRVWASDVKSRITKPLVLWSALPVLGSATQTPVDFQLVLAVTDNGSEIVALSASRGERVASFSLSESEGKLVGMPVATPDGRIVVARQKYAASEASLMVLMLEPPDEQPVGPPAPDTTPEPQASIHHGEGSGDKLSAIRSDTDRP
jgi:hypothetical protein